MLRALRCTEWGYLLGAVATVLTHTSESLHLHEKISSDINSAHRLINRDNPACFPYMSFKACPAAATSPSDHWSARSQTFNTWSREGARRPRALVHPAMISVLSGNEEHRYSSLTLPHSYQNSLNRLAGNCLALIPAKAINARWHKMSSYRCSLNGA